MLECRNQINATGDINVTAEIAGDHLRLTDNTGQTVSNLKVQKDYHKAMGIVLQRTTVNAPSP